jgi:hypothetical protein
MLSANSSPRAVTFSPLRSPSESPTMVLHGVFPLHYSPPALVSIGARFGWITPTYPNSVSITHSLKTPFTSSTAGFTLSVSCVKQWEQMHAAATEKISGLLASWRFQYWGTSHRLLISPSDIQRCCHISIAEKICLILDRSDWSGDCLFHCLPVVNVNIVMFKWYTWNWKCHSSYFSIHEGVINRFLHV